MVGVVARGDLGVLGMTMVLGPGRGRRDGGGDGWWLDEAGPGGGEGGGGDPVGEGSGVEEEAGLAAIAVFGLEGAQGGGVAAAGAGGGFDLDA